ncbi:serum response factor-binding protein 1 isoform X2 [Carcharodon carcharias]|uniref:serum response factor-binding protein 1 isoform X2 n=1 Tax=Carcharodon carcharias TaxID=13397 RepID=UPI001B7F6DDB|nr:serum response factor-binding protein 1 isoform X2 [Carcharodon carcharias]
MAAAVPMNINNEIVKLRKDVKKARTLIIRKLTRNIAQLKAKKGMEDAILKNVRRAERLLEEIHTMKDLKPDYVSRTALQRDLNFETVCKKPNSTVVERAVARIVSHPLISKKIAAIKAAVNSFTEARQKAKEQRLQSLPDLQTGALQQASPEENSPDKTNEIKKDDTAGEKTKTPAMKQTSAIVNKPETEAPHEVRTSITQAAEVTLAHQDIEEKKCTLSETQKELNVPIKSENTKPIEADVSNQDVSSDEEKEYFDDSTEERFYNQTTSDDSGDDDFFIGKVKKINKKKQELDPTFESNTVKEDKKSMPSIMKEGKNDPKKNSGTKTFGSLFCNNLSGSKASTQKSHFRGNNQSKKSDVKQDKSLSFRDRSCRRPGVVIPKPQQSLHPSWEASRKRKEQTQILAFQGKKIRFDD